MESPMSALLDLTGQKFGKLTVIKRVKNRKNTHVCWLCKCECGKETIKYGSSLKRSSIISCGCTWRTGRKPVEVKEGTRFGHLTIIKSLGTRKVWYCEYDVTTRQFFLCQCDCGKQKEYSYSDLMAGVKTCGCGKRGRGARNN